MKQNMVESLLGAFVLVVAVVFFIYGTGKASIGGSSGGYQVTAKFNDIGSLGVGDDVKISGVTIGSISGVTLVPAPDYRANVIMAINNNVQLPSDTAARISSQGLLGGTYMALDVGGDENMMGNGDEIYMTQSAQNLEQLLGKFIFSLQDTKKDEEE